MLDVGCAIIDHEPFKDPSVVDATGWEMYEAAKTKDQIHATTTRNLIMYKMT